MTFNPNNYDWHSLEISAVLAHLHTSADVGLTMEEAQRRIGEFGSNELKHSDRLRIWRILLRQFRSLLVLMLIAAGMVALAFGDSFDAIAIFAMVLLNVALGFRQEYSAENAIAALKRMSVPVMRVLRSGGIHNLPANELVPGDIVLLEAGSIVPADCRLIESASLRVQEAVLTGESDAVNKDHLPVLTPTTAVTDRVNMAYMGTAAVHGRAKGLVVLTGNRTEVGRIAGMLGGVTRTASLLEGHLNRMARVLALLVLAVAGLIFLFGLRSQENLRQLFLVAVSLSVAAVPEGLAVVVTVSLAVGSQRMLKRNALVRRLTAVETLGLVTVVCTDKTGTLTQNRMEAREVFVGDRIVSLNSGSRTNDQDLDLLLACGALCNDATREVTKNSWIGDPTDVALAQACELVDLRKDDLDCAMPRHFELPFDSARKRVTTVHRVSRGTLPATISPVLDSIGLQLPYIAFTKGSIEGLLSIVSSRWSENQAKTIDAARLERILKANEGMTSKGMRVLGLAFRPLPDWKNEDIERQMIFLGLVASLDPARPESAPSVATCSNAGIRTVMITGDHPLTAIHVAGQVGIANNGQYLTGPQLDLLSDEQLRSKVLEISVYARVSPEHKLRIVAALQQQGHVVAMTGDGVNDAPALKKADVGIAMGQTGTDVAREASDIVLTDDNFATIVAAIKEGRVIYDNLRKFIRYLLSCNCGELFLVLLAVLAAMPLPLSPLQILWMNLVTDGLPALALSFEPAERDVMERPPRRRDEPIVNREMMTEILWSGAVLGLSSLLMGLYAWSTGRQEWRTVIFTVLTLSQLALAFAHRSSTTSAFRLGLASNARLLGGVCSMFGLHLALLYVPPLQKFFSVMPLSFPLLMACVGVSVLPFLAVEAKKWFIGRRQPVGALAAA